MTEDNKNSQLLNPHLIEEVFGSHKARDLYVLERLAEGARQVDVANEVKLRQARISVIAINNRVLLDKLTFNSKFSTKAGRLRLAFRCLQGRVSSKKDTIEILDYIRKEMEGDVQFKQQINQFISVNDEQLDSVIKEGLENLKKITGAEGKVVDVKEEPKNTPSQK
jgi:hypothetical protein